MAGYQLDLLCRIYEAMPSALARITNWIDTVKVYSITEGSCVWPLFSHAQSEKMLWSPCLE